MEKIVQTERLLLRQFNVNDVDFIIQLLNSPGWIKNIGDRNIKTVEQAKNYLLNGPMQSYQLHGFGLSLVMLKETNTPIGMCGLIKRDTLPHVDIGFAFLPAYIGKGYCYEMASAILMNAKNNFKLPRIVAVTLPTNISSVNVLKKLGMQFDKKIILKGDTEELELYGIDL
ncbi:MAG: GNAT family N-acetyltransferase [Bacteroidia bacterium]